MLSHLVGLRYEHPHDLIQKINEYIQDIYMAKRMSDRCNEYRRV